MAESNPWNRKTHPTEWQNWISEQAVRHDREQRATGNKFQKPSLPPSRSTEDVKKEIADED